MKKIKTCDIVYIFIITVIALWFLISSIDIMAHQFSGGTDAEWNMYNFLIKLAESFTK